MNAIVPTAIYFLPLRAASKDAFFIEDIEPPCICLYFSRSILLSLELIDLENLFFCFIRLP